jgi:hypothetical protein
MIEHLSAIFVVSVLRAVVEAALGAYILLVSWRWEATWAEGWLQYVPGVRPGAQPLPGDRGAFVAIACVLLVLGAVRFVQALHAFLRREFARRFGQALAIVDFLTPLTLPLGLWCLIVYRHPDTRDFFRNRYGDALDRGDAITGSSPGLPRARAPASRGARRWGRA